MPDGYSRWREDAAGKEPTSVDTNIFYRKCPCCAEELTISLKDEQMENGTFERTLDTVEGRKGFGEPKMRQIEPQSAAEAIPAPADRKCAYCFRNAIRGGVLCREHAFCRSCETQFPDGKPFEIKEFPMCEACSR